MPCEFDVNRTMKEQRSELFIGVPAYNDERRLARTLERIRVHLTNWHGVFIAVDDGSVDGTACVVQEWARKIRCLRLESNGVNRGRRATVLSRDKRTCGVIY